MIEKIEIVTTKSKKEGAMDGKKDRRKEGREEALSEKVGCARYLISDLAKKLVIKDGEEDGLTFIEVARIIAKIGMAEEIMNDWLNEKNGL